MQALLLIFRLLFVGIIKFSNGKDSEEVEIIPYSNLYHIFRTTGIFPQQLHSPVPHHLPPLHAISTYFNPPGVKRITDMNRYSALSPYHGIPTVHTISPSLYSVNPDTVVLSPYGVFYNPTKFHGYFAPLLPNQNIPGFDRGEEEEEEKITFEDSECLRYGRVGSCAYIESECQIRGGEAHQFCPDIRKQCCLFYHTKCNVITKGKIIHIENEAHPLSTIYSKACNYRIEKSSKDICGFRFTFVRIALPGSIGNCDDVSFKLSGYPSLSLLQPICGALSGLKYDVMAKNIDHVVLNLAVKTPKFVSFKIKVKQMKCGQPLLNLWPNIGTESTHIGVSRPTPSPPKVPVADESKAPVSDEPKAPVADEPKAPVADEPKAPVADEPIANEKPAVENTPVVAEKPSGSKPLKEVKPNVAVNPALLSCGFSTFYHKIPKTSSLRRSALELEESAEIEDELCLGESCPTNLNRNPLLSSDEWNVPSVNESELFEAAGTFLPLDGRITFGKKTIQHEHPWQIVMYVRGRFHCSGSIISRRDILTAAHCVSRYKFNPSALKITLGDYDVKSQTDGPNIIGVPQKIIVHEGYSARKLQNDIAIIRLRDSLTFSHRISPVCLPDSDLNLEGKLVTVTGWGRNENNRLQSVLMKHTAAVLSNSICNQRWKKRARGKDLIVNTMMCMDPQDGDSCKGDSGGPCVVEHPKGSKKYTLAGIVSFGSASCTDKKLPGVYTRVGRMLPWIRKNMKL